MQCWEGEAWGEGRGLRGEGTWCSVGRRGGRGSGAFAGVVKGVGEAGPGCRLRDYRRERSESRQGPGAQLPENF